VEAKKQEAQHAKKGVEVESPKVETEQKSILNKMIDLNVENSELSK